MSAYLVKDMKKSYGKRLVLDIPELCIEENRIYALLGPNGSGKSTLLNLLSFLDHPTSGTIQYDSQLVMYKKKELLRLRKEVVMVDQHPILFSSTVFKNMEFGLKMRRIAKKRREYLIEEGLELMGMRRFASEPAHKLSGGETQRVALARALVLSPRVLLCDEPTGSVDRKYRDVILETLRNIHREKKNLIIFTTHDRSQAEETARHTIILDEGRIIDPKNSI